MTIELTVLYVAGMAVTAMLWGLANEAGYDGRPWLKAAWVLVWPTLPIAFLGWQMWQVVQFAWSKRNG